MASKCVCVCGERRTSPVGIVKEKRDWLSVVRFPVLG